jgi:hypothetical protein
VSVAGQRAEKKDPFAPTLAKGSFFGPHPPSMIGLRRRLSPIPPPGIEAGRSIGSLKKPPGTRVVHLGQVGKLGFSLINLVVFRNPKRGERHLARPVNRAISFAVRRPQGALRL